jgi:hypothetical protein
VGLYFERYPQRILPISRPAVAQFAERRIASHPSTGSNDFAALCRHPGGTQSKFWFAIDYMLSYQSLTVKLGAYSILQANPFPDTPAVKTAASVFKACGASANGLPARKRLLRLSPHFYEFQ